MRVASRAREMTRPSSSIAKSGSAAMWARSVCRVIATHWAALGVQAHLAEAVAGRVDAVDDLAVAFVDRIRLHAAGQHDVQRVAAVALLDQQHALAVAARLAARGERTQRAGQAFDRRWAGGRGRRHRRLGFPAALARRAGRCEKL